MILQTVWQWEYATHILQSFHKNYKTGGKIVAKRRIKFYLFVIWRRGILIRKEIKRNKKSFWRVNIRNKLYSELMKTT